MSRPAGRDTPSNTVARVSDPDAVSTVDLLRWAESLSGIARTGLGFTQSLYERERFEEVLKVAADIRAGRGRGSRSRAASTTSGSPPSATASPATSPRRSPSAAVVGNDAGELLLTQRADSGVWLYPVGWADVGYSPSEVAVKEVEEETGILVEPASLIAVFDGLRLGFARLALYSLVFHCRMLGGRAPRASARDPRRRVLRRGRAPWPLAGGARWVDTAFAAIDGRAPAGRLRPAPHPAVAGRLIQATAAASAAIV